MALERIFSDTFSRVRSHEALRWGAFYAAIQGLAVVALAGVALAALSPLLPLVASVLESASASPESQSDVVSRAFLEVLAFFGAHFELLLIAFVAVLAIGIILFLLGAWIELHLLRVGAGLSSSGHELSVGTLASFVVAGILGFLAALFFPFSGRARLLVWGGIALSVLAAILGFLFWANPIVLFVSALLLLGGLLAWFAGFVFSMVAFSLFPPVLASNPSFGPMAVLNESVRLSRGRLLELGVLLLVMASVLYFGKQLVGFLFVILVRLVGAMAGGMGILFSLVLEWLVWVLVEAAAFVLFAVFLGVLFAHFSTPAGSVSGSAVSSPRSRGF